MHGIYWKVLCPCIQCIEGFISNVVVANPKWVKAIKGEKDDNKDAKWIADLFKMGLVRSSYIPSKDFRVLREFTRYRYKLTNISCDMIDHAQNRTMTGNNKTFFINDDLLVSRNYWEKI